MPSNLSAHAMKTTPKAGRCWRPAAASMPRVAANNVISTMSPSLGIAALRLERSVVARKCWRWVTSSTRITAATRDDAMPPPRARCAMTVKASAPTAKNHERRCPRRIPRAVMIMPMPAAAVKAAADWATPRGSTVSTRCRRPRSGGDAVTATFTTPSRNNRPLATRRIDR